MIDHLWRIGDSNSGIKLSRMFGIVWALRTSPFEVERKPKDTSDAIRDQIRSYITHR